MQLQCQSSRTRRDDGKHDAWNKHVQVASQAKITTEDYGPDDERQEVGREEREHLRRHHVPRIQKQKVKKMTQAKNQERKEIGRTVVR